MKRRPQFPSQWAEEKTLPKEYYLFSDDEDHPISFETMLEKAKEQEPLKEGEVLCYIGSGTFAVFKRTHTENRKEVLQELRRLEPHNPHRGSWQKQYRCTVFPEYEPKPRRLLEIFADTQENIFSQPQSDQ